MKPMLAGKVDLALLNYPVYASPKLDGIRAVVKDGKLLSRKLMEFPNPHVHSLFAKKKYEGLDGELMVGSPTDPQVRNLTSGSMNRKSGTPDVKFHVFDLWNSKEAFDARVSLVKKYASDNIIVVPQVHVSDEHELLFYEDQCLEQGYEGLIVRDYDGLYKFGRSTTKEGGMLKLKRFEDAEAKVLRVIEENENTNEAERDNLGRTKRSKAKAGMVGKGRAGKLEVVGTNGLFEGIEFEVPLSTAGDVGKALWWKNRARAPGVIITYRFFPKGVKNKPLLPTLVGTRHNWDIS